MKKEYITNRKNNIDNIVWAKERLNEEIKKNGDERNGNI